MPPKDRTQEFHATLNSIKSRSVQPASSSSKSQDKDKQRLLAPNGPSGRGSKSEFARMAGQIGKDINATTLKLQKLAQRE